MNGCSRAEVRDSATAEQWAGKLLSGKQVSEVAELDWWELSAAGSCVTLRCACSPWHLPSLSQVTPAAGCGSSSPWGCCWLPALHGAVAPQVSVLLRDGVNPFPGTCNCISCSSVSQREWLESFPLGGFDFFSSSWQTVLGATAAAC